MGLYAEFSPEDFGFPSDFSASTEDGDVYVEVNYSEAIDDAINTFMEIATSLVPIDTGYLCSTISAYSDGDTVCFSADAEYAQYPEYGTWCQAEQPYFRPALQEAIDVFIIDAVRAIDEAQNEFVSEMELSAAESAGQKSAGGSAVGARGSAAGIAIGSTEGSTLGSIGAGFIFGILLTPLFIIGMEFSSIMEEGNNNPTPDLSMLNSGGGGDSIDADSLVEIT